MNSLNEVKFIIEQIETTFDGDSWHGPSLMKTLEGVDLEQANMRPLVGRHTIWENLEHIIFWIDPVIEALKGELMPDLQTVKDWPETGETKEEWMKTIQKLRNRINMLTGEVLKLDPKQLDSTVPGAQYKYRKMLHGVVHHNLYHAGQIAILKKK
jgi:hypothetical protein